MSCLPCSTAWRRCKKRWNGCAAGPPGRVEMETALLCLCSPELDTSTAALLRRLQAVETALRAGTFAPPEASAAPAAVPSKAAEAPVLPAPEETEEPLPPPAAPPWEEEAPASGTADSPGDEEPASDGSSGTPASIEEAPFPRWNDVLETLSQTCPPLYGVLVGSAATLRGDLVLIRTNSDLFRSLVSRDGNKAHLVGALRGVTGKTYRIGDEKSPLPRKRRKRPIPLAAFIRNSRELGVEVKVKEN